jgi:two-component system cell cycle sensor histidine kinase/response regulator CckA
MIEGKLGHVNGVERLVGGPRAVTKRVVSQDAYLPGSLGRAFFGVPPLILVVEDEPTVQRATCRMLELEGYVCRPAQDAEQALELLATGHIPDLMVIDVRLPGISGPELALRVHTRYPRIPVLFVSGWVDGLADPALLDRMHWAFLAKPYNPAALVGAAQRMLGIQPTTEGV